MKHDRSCQLAGTIFFVLGFKENIALKILIKAIIKNIFSSNFLIISPINGTYDGVPYG